MPVTVITREADGLDLEATQRAERGSLLQAMPQRGLHVLHDVLCFPRRYGLWSSSGDLIRESLFVRRNGAHTWPDFPARVATDSVRRQHADPVVWMGIVQRHFGHLVTESIARLWAWAEAAVGPEVRFLVSAEPGTLDAPGSVAAVLFAGAGLGERLLMPTEPTRFTSVILPMQSFSLQGPCYPNHVAVPRRIASAILAKEHSPSREVPVYLSRSGGTFQRPAVNETELEDHLRQAGVRIVHPEQLSFGEQVALWNSHDTVVGMLGSAFHAMVFSLRGREQRTIVLCEEIPSHYAAIDLMTGVDATYLRCVDGGDWEDRTAPRRIDMDFARRSLAQLGILSA